MYVDWYTKIVLTAIAIALLGLLGTRLFDVQDAQAVSGEAVSVKIVGIEHPINSAFSPSMLHPAIRVYCENCKE